MNSAFLLLVAAGVAVVVAAVVGLMLRKVIVGATFHANLTPEDRRDLMEMKVLMDNLRKDHAVQGEALAKRDGRIEERIEALGGKADMVGDNAHKLAKAIRGDAQLMGSWGEFQLKKVLEISGLTEGVSYTYQESFADEDSTRRNKRTDVQVKLPNDKVVVIDSKNTLPSYLDYNAAETDEDREVQKGRIVESVRKHMDEIITARYQKNIKNCYRKVIMYFPFEIPYLIACSAEVRIGSEKRWLREYAYENDIIFATASNLLPILEGVALFWAAQDQDEKIGKALSGMEKLCAKMNGFVENYRKLGKQLTDMGATYKAGMGQLAEGPGNVMKRMGELKELKIESAAKLPSDEELLMHANKVQEADIAETT